MGREDARGAGASLEPHEELTRNSLAACAATAALLGLLGRGLAAEEAPRIDTVEIRPTNVFTDEEASVAFFPYRLANLLHIRTRSSFIQNQLLFKPGDPLLPELLAETERNLRAFGLFRKAYVRAEGTRIVVETADAWTLLLRGSLSNKGGVTTYSIGAEEYNLFGLGMQFGFGWEKETDRSSRSVFFVAPDVFAPHAILDLQASDLSDGQHSTFAYGRGFYALEVPWALESFFDRALSNTKLYAGGEESVVWKQREHVARLSGGMLLSGDLTVANRLLGSIEWNEVRLGAGGEGPPPPSGPSSDRTFLFLSLGFEHVGSNWITRRQVEKIERDEDFNLAPTVRVEAGVSPNLEGARTAGRLVTSLGAGTAFPSGFALFSATGSTRLEDGIQNATVGADARGYLLTGPWAFVGHVGTLVGWRLDPEVQIPLDGSTGVRGYRLHAVEGDRRFVMNAETRVLVVPEILSLLSFGLAAFGDAGFSWGPPDGSWTLADAGVGVRIGITRASKNSLVRIDLARVLHPDPLGRTGWLVSFASSQAF